MQLSIIIVNYNVKYFIDQCLLSVEKAIENIDAEIFVVDNNSADGSCSMIKEKYKNVYLIANKKNTGFSYANNQAIKMAKGEYVLLLNPDTVVEEDSFEKCLSFMNNHKDAGALTVKMIDGKGHYLPESKRGLPTPCTAFYKIFGLTKLFPKSKKFARYYLGHLNKDEINEIEILPGAFMFMRKNCLENVGYLDEDYFMYGEDIDLSYRLLKSGYKNYYFPKTTIIHYKGESTKKSSVNYVLVFYNAMIIFARKHFSKKNAKIFSLFIKLAIYFRASIAILNRAIKKVILPIFDFGFIFLSYLIIKPIWENYLFGEIGSYPKEFLFIAVPIYIIIWLNSIAFYGSYKKHIKPLNIIKGTTIGTIIILLIYSLVPESYRFSRALIILGYINTTLVTFSTRLIISNISYFPQKLIFNNKLRTLILGSKDEILRVKNILEKTQLNPQIIGYVAPENFKPDNFYLGELSQLHEIIIINKADEVIFCAKDISSQQIIKNMLKLSNSEINFKIAPANSLSVIGSNSINTAGELYTIELSSISNSKNKRIKRIFDILSSSIIILFFPILLLFYKNSLNIFKNSISVFFGKKTWIGYCHTSKSKSYNLPKIKNSIFMINNYKLKETIPDSTIEKLNILYAKNYKLTTDIIELFKNLKHLNKQNS